MTCTRGSIQQNFVRFLLIPPTKYCAVNPTQWVIPGILMKSIMVWLTLTSYSSAGASLNGQCSQQILKGTVDDSISFLEAQHRLTPPEQDSECVTVAIGNLEYSSSPKGVSTVKRNSTLALMGIFRKSPPSLVRLLRQERSKASGSGAQALLAAARYATEACSQRFKQDCLTELKEGAAPQ